MTPKEKAEELVGKFNSISQYGVSALTFENSKQCALIAVDELIREAATNFSENYWNKVREEIVKL